MRNRICVFFFIATAIVVSFFFLSRLWLRSPEINAEYASQLAKDVLSLSGTVSAQKMKGGHSGASLFLVTSGRDRYVVRFFPYESIDRAREIIHNTKTASDIGYGPHIYFSDDENRVLIMEYLPSKYSSYLQHLKILLQPKQSEKLCVSLGHFLRKIHRGPTVSGFKNVFDNIKKRMKNVSRSVSDVVPLEKIEKILDSIHVAIAQHPDIAPCHNDLNQSNLIVLEDNEVKVIDYDDFAQGNPYYDIAYVATFYCLSPICERSLLFSYFEREASLVEKAKLYLMQQVVLISEALFLLKRSVSELHRYKILQTLLFKDLLKNASEGNINLGNPRDVLKIAKSMFNQVLLNAESQEFNNAVTLLNEASLID